MPLICDSGGSGRGRGVVALLASMTAGTGFVLGHQNLSLYPLAVSLHPLSTSYLLVSVVCTCISESMDNTPSPVLVHSLLWCAASQSSVLAAKAGGCVHRSGRTIPTVSYDELRWDL